MKEFIANNLVAKVIISSLLLAASGCSLAGPVADEFNPFGEGSSSAPELGVRNNSSLAGGAGGTSKEAESARHALEVVGSYRRAQDPQPIYPVVRPAEVRLMWIPDHQNRHGDLVPAHYYYLRVMNDGWELQDAFEVENQLKENAGGGASVSSSNSGASFGTGGGGASTPWVYKEK